MKKLISLLLVLTLATLALASCAAVDDTKIRIGYLTGPTGMGLSKLINDNGGSDGNDKYEFIPYANKTTEALTKLLSGEVDIVCNPTKEAAEYVTEHDSDIKILAINTLGTLYLVGTDAESINDIYSLQGKTIYVPANGTPKMVLEALLDEYDISANVTSSINEAVIAEPAQLFAKIQADTEGAISLAVVPEPIVSNILMAKQNYSIKLDLSEAWDAKFSTPIAMGCILAKESFINEHPSLVARFLEEYSASINFVSKAENIETSAKYIFDAGILPKEPLAKRALGNLGDAIAYVDGEEMKEILEAFYTKIGVTLPDASFYYEK